MWKTPKVPLADECTKKFAVCDTILFGLRKRGIVSLAIMGMNLENILPSNKSVISWRKEKMGSGPM